MVLLTEISAESPSTYDYDVFLSFRGTDTRYNFTDHLHKALLEATVDTFLDDTEIQIGECLKPELESAIRSSRASVIVLSQNYASSTWCLDELALIMEQRRTSEHIVFPIFYHVEPTHVRKQRNSFGEAMAKHKRRMEAELDEENRCLWAQKIKQWEKALTEVADLKGEEANGRRETILIEGIVKKISCRLDIHKRSEIPKLIGMEASVRTITSFLKDKSGQSTDILTILGMAGIGKTYLANYVFQLHYLDFDRSCFLEDIERRGAPPNGSLLDLQKQLLKDIRALTWMDISNVNAATFKIEKSLIRKRTLLVLDGINWLEQLDALIGTKGLHPGSKIIITSKDGSLTEKCRLFKAQVPPKHVKHMLQGLNDKESLRLLSWHAYGRNEPNKGDKRHIMKVVDYCKGHPLALKVLGSSFRSEDATWDDILQSLKNKINPDITKVLKVSFDTLPSEKDKELFKHIACLFIGEDRKCTEDILKACGICKSSGIKVLINRCLLTIGYSDKLMMHQLLQEMGRDIVRQESPKKPWKRSILWHPEECLDVLQTKQVKSSISIGTTLIQGLVLDMRTFKNGTSKKPSSANMKKFGLRSYSSSSWVHILLLSVFWWLFGWVSGLCSSSRKTKGDFETLALNEMRNLRLLRLNYVQLSGSYKNFPQGLKWLCMHGFPLSCIPSDLQMENMVALDMSNSKLQQLWKKPKLLGSLKFLNLSSCHALVRVGHFSGLPLLERLILARCTSLVEVCESIGANCKKLALLDLSKCDKLKELPRSIGKLKNLTQLLLDGCSNLGEFPIEMKDMESLKILNADNVNMKFHKSSSSSNMVLRNSKSFVSYLPRSLVKLSLKNCNLYNESFPLDFSSLSMLEELYLDRNRVDSMPECVRSLSRLKILSFYACFNLKNVLCAPILLDSLEVDNCSSLETITFHPEKLALPVFKCFDCLALTEIQYKFKTQALSEIDEGILHGLGWINIEYLNHYRFLKADLHGAYIWPGRIVPAQVVVSLHIFNFHLIICIYMCKLYKLIKLLYGQMLYEHGIFSTYLQGQEVPKWFTHRSSGSSFTLDSSSKKGKIRGLNVCIVYTISNASDVGPSRIKISNLAKNSSWTYQPRMFAAMEHSQFKHGRKAVVVWLSNWMFNKNEFEDGDKVSIQFSVKFKDIVDLREPYIFHDSGGADRANVREYGISLVFDDVGGNQKEDALGCYRSWKHIIGGDLSAFELSSKHYLLVPSPRYVVA
ncbi:disease resistance protein RML1A-like [Bidens hawaiensis]|uniref:disease resistance protein RML1A-like n=1 Tax=Bidens hawaiensis TaxID=980011 RepID=UPI00404ABEA3